MNENTRTSALIDGVLRVLLAGGAVTAGVIAPNILQVLDKPVAKSLKKLDDRAQRREFVRVLAYMRRQKLIKTNSENYLYGIAITKKGSQRVKNAEIEDIKIIKSEKWDKKWRLVFYDIPESKKYERQMLSRKLREIGFQLMQRSIWVCPYECRKQIEDITGHYQIAKYVSYIETTYIDNQEALKRKFRIP